ncbi:MAG: Ca2+-binding EF-hand superfamily protein [Verrucomicrobiales bacterium]|jgi:Ca2+-binding EF-hand superfamily protein
MKNSISILFYVTLATAPAFAQENRLGLDVETIQEFSNLDRNGDGGLDRLEFAFSETAQRAREIGDRERVDAVFALIDEDEDELTSLVEFSHSQQNRNARLFDRESARSFDPLDSDASGILTLAEYLKSPIAVKALANGKTEQFVTEAFKRIDINESKTIGPIEWLQVVSAKPFFDEETAIVFALIDSDDSGSIDASERAEISPDAPELAKFVEEFERIDLNGNGELGPREFAKAQQAKPVGPPIEADFIELDRNEDGGLSLREFERHDFPKGPPPRRGMIEDLFEYLDGNEDRELSPEEFGNRRGKGRPPGPPPPKGKGKKKGPPPF